MIMLITFLSYITLAAAAALSSERALMGMYQNVSFMQSVPYLWKQCKRTHLSFDIDTDCKLIEYLLLLQKNSEKLNKLPSKERSFQINMITEVTSYASIFEDFITANRLYND